MTSREPKKPKAPKPLEVRVMFEPSRLAATCIAQAYERIIPIMRRVVAPRQLSSGIQAQPTSTKQRAEGGAR